MESLSLFRREAKFKLYIIHMYMNINCSPYFLHVHLPIPKTMYMVFASTATGFAIAPDNLMILILWVQVTEKSGWVAFSFFNHSAPFKFFRHKSACTATPVLRLTMYSLTAYLFTKSHIAECIKSSICLSIIERNKKKTIPMATPILLLLLLTASLPLKYCCSCCQSPWLLKHCSSFCYQPPSPLQH